MISEIASRTTSVAILLLILLSSVCAFPATVVAEDEPALKGVAACNKALQLIQEGNALRALEVMKAAKGTLAEEDDWLWWGNTGHCYKDLRRDKEAMSHYARALEIKSDCWFRFAYSRLLHEYGRWTEALEELEKPIDSDYAPRAAALKSVIQGPYVERWPLAHKKLECKSKKGNYLVVSDAGVTSKELDLIEAQASKLDLSDKNDRKKYEKLIKPSKDLVSLSNLAELARDQYLKFTKVDKKAFPEGKISKVFFMMEEAEFHDFAAKNGNSDTEQTLGFYSPNFKYIQMYSQEGAESKVFGLSLDTIDTFFHEGWHQTIDQVVGNMPIWMNEGIAEFLGHAKVESKGAKISLGLLVRVRGETYTRYEWIKLLMKKKTYTPFTDFFRFTDEDWYTGEVDDYYAQSWSIAYFALMGSDTGFKKAYATLFRELVKGRPASEIIDEVFPDKKLKAFEQSWLKFWAKT
ncbi:DUF1570 domain-containing protein [Planctomycetota bacterium]|nr:DUF1570 domain-containing protein [Planctomycetota bacterium]